MVATNFELTRGRQSNEHRRTDIKSNKSNMVSYWLIDGWNYMDCIGLVIMKQDIDKLINFIAVTGEHAACSNDCTGKWRLIVAKKQILELIEQQVKETRQLPRRDYYDNPEETHDVPCRFCGSKEWTDWLLLPHKLFNEVDGYLCFPCFLKNHPLVLELIVEAREDELTKLNDDIHAVDPTFNDGQPYLISLEESDFAEIIQDRLKALKSTLPNQPKTEEGGGGE